MPAKNTKSFTPSTSESVDRVAEYKRELKEKLNNKYKLLNTRLQAEPNIILRYELKLSIECLLDIYQTLFPGE